VETTELKDMIDQLLDDNNLDAAEAFQSVISAKVASALEDKKMELAQSLGTNRNESE
jgi:hypothetical protein